MDSLEKIRIALEPTPLEGDALNNYYINLVDARGGDNPIMSLKRVLNHNPLGKRQILFSGYRGCGKSTELNRLISEIEGEFIVVKLNLLKELDPINLNYVEIIILVMEKLFEAAKIHKIKPRNSFLESIQSWVKSEEIEKIRTYSTELGVESELSASLDLPWFLSFFSKIRAAASRSTSAKKTIREVVEPRLSDLLNHCNDLIREIKENLEKIEKSGMLLVIEDMDKLSLEKSEELFFNHSNILTGLQTNVIFTFPIALRHHPKANVVTANFQENFELPMVKVKDKLSKKFEPGQEGLFKLIKARTSAKLFASEKLIYKFIEMSGGCIRDLFRMIIDASDYALNNQRNKIGEEDFRKSMAKMKRNYRNAIADKIENNQVVLSADTYYSVLVNLAKDPKKQIMDTLPVLDLRQNLCILSYNDEGWCDVHPVVREILHDDGQL
ncbi:MAG: hypothetical protein R3C61_13775 [Bacteroidia bacterium]